MVQCAHFAYDDEELPTHWGTAGNCSPFEDQEEDIEEDLPDLPDLTEMEEEFDLSPSCDLSRKMEGENWSPAPVREEQKGQPYWPTDSHHNKEPT